MQYKAITYLQLGEQLDLTCHISGEDTGVVWVHQGNVETFKFIVFISPLSEATFEGNQKTSTHFEARKEDTIYHLVVKSFTPQDEGNYFCMMIYNQMLFFSPGQPAFLPGQQHLHPTSLSSDKMPSTSCPCPFSQLSLPQTPFPCLLAQGIL